MIQGLREKFCVKPDLSVDCMHLDQVSESARNIFQAVTFETWTQLLRKRTYLFLQKKIFCPFLAQNFVPIETLPGRKYPTSNQKILNANFFLDSHSPGPAFHQSVLLRSEIFETFAQRVRGCGLAGGGAASPAPPSPPAASDSPDA